jgi:hypothetical protein
MILIIYFYTITSNKMMIKKFKFRNIIMIKQKIKNNYIIKFNKMKIR